MPRPQFRLRSLFILTAIVAVGCLVGKPEVPDGEIIHVNQKSGTVWINVGRADDLRRLVTFSVVGGDKSVGKFQPTKGHIEVTELLGPHVAECRILGNKISDPLVPGDKIFTPLWHPGRSEGFGVVGKFDLDGDGKDDRDMIIDLITIAGGQVDAQVDPKTSKMTGKLNIKTRYLLVGEESDESTMLGGYAAIFADAKRFGVEKITLDKFLDHLGWKDQGQTITYGSKGNAGSDVVPMPSDSEIPLADGTVSDLFKKRKPSRRGAESTP